ncbi:sugar nucleotide-binding protein [Pseudoroseicyclus tamaricis]|uniref:Sugar nucleotide-binding protein n=1 Tax=Pseudoroseicyclus tamaricis TaxID=2705421 RepID=A0A6B2K0X6_9RHOB|nr:sugar nucleotide-binding protein [Pseudoroseicyclus tamaricis]NDV02599.1 sugar nucleotide-binding protein [Pseudoroseicyclus tamaricis]
MTGTALILGPSGKIGSNASRAFEAAGWHVRHYKRGTDMTEAARGADVIVNGLNPPNYHDWDRIIPAITAQVIAAAEASGATIIHPATVYNLGDRPGTWDETTPHRPVARKGRIREEMEDAFRASSAQVILLRAGHFIDPERDDDIMGIGHLRALRRGRVTALGGTDVHQAYAYLPDWSRAAEALAARRETLPRYNDIPFPGHSFSVRELTARLEGLSGRPLKIFHFPWWLFRVTGPLWELAREMTEMRYLYETDHRLGATRLSALLPEFRATELDAVLRRCLPEGWQRAGGAPMTVAANG